MFRIGEITEAESWFLEALKTKPDHVPAHLTYGKMLARNVNILKIYSFKICRKYSIIILKFKIENKTIRGRTVVQKSKENCSTRFIRLSPLWYFNQLVILHYIYTVM